MCSSRCFLLPAPERSGKLRRIAAERFADFAEHGGIACVFCLLPKSQGGCFRSSGPGGRGAFSAAAPCRKRGNRAACRIFLPRKARKQALPEFFASRPARFRQECGRDVVCAGARRTRGVRRSASPPCGRRRPFLRDFFLCLTFPRKTAARSAVRPFSCRGAQQGGPVSARKRAGPPGRSSFFAPAAPVGSEWSCAPQGAYVYLFLGYFSAA